MKNAFKFLLLSPLLFTSMSCNQTNENTESKPNNEPVNVVVISGQSNAVGCTHTNCITRSLGSEKYREYMKGYEGVKIAYDCWTKDEGPIYYSQNKSKDDDFVKVMVGQGNSQATFGPEIGISEALHEEFNGKLFIIKYACGASNLKDDWLKKDSPMYGRFIKYVKKQMDNLKNKGYVPSIKAFCWMQGEGDSYEGYYDVYYDNTKEFVTNVRNDLKEYNEKEIPFIDAGINNSKDPTSGALIWQHYKKVNEAKAQFASESENNIYIDTIAEGLHTNEEPFDSVDPAHYDTASQVQLGHLFAESFKPFLIK